MKKLITMIVLLTLTVGQTIAGEVKLRIKSNANKPMTIFIDGQQVANMNTQVVVDGLIDGNHYVEIFTMQNNGWIQNTYLAYNGYIYLPNNTFSKYKLKQNNQFVLQEQLALYTPPAPGGCGTPPPPIAYNNPYNDPYYVPQPPICENQTPFYGNTCTQQIGCACGSCNYSTNGCYDNYTYTASCTQQVGCGCGNCNNNVYNPYPTGNGYNNHGYNQYNCMTDANFNQLLTSINNQWFSSDMMNVYEQALYTNHFSAAQVKQLVNAFTYDNDKLKVAKTAYTQTVDKENYFVVYDALDYSSSVNQLTAYISTL